MADRASKTHFSYRTIVTFSPFLVKQNVSNMPYLTKITYIYLLIFDINYTYTTNFMQNGVDFEYSFAFLCSFYLLNL